MSRAAIALGLALLALVGCSRRAESSAPAGVVVDGVAEFRVERLFTHDGCTVYRFRDSYERYFTRCDGVAARSDTQWSESCGKNCSREVSVSGGAK